MASKLSKISDEELKELATKAISMSDMIRLLGINHSGGVYATLLKRVLALGIDPRNQGLKGVKDVKGNFSKILTQDILDGLHPTYQTMGVKRRLIEENFMKYECSWCGISDWREQRIALELDHIDGNRWNHKLENLRLLCPNCHSQTPTYKSKKRL